MDMWWASGSAADLPGLGRQEASWVAYGGQKCACALRRGEYVKSQDLVNTSHRSRD